MEGKQIAEVYQIKGCRAYIKRTGLQFSDSEVGTLLFHSGMPYHELHCALKELAERTADQELRRQIEERIAYDELYVYLFRTNDGSFFFAVSVDAGSKECEYDEIIGYFASVELALAFMKGKNVPLHRQEISDCRPARTTCEIRGACESTPAFATGVLRLFYPCGIFDGKGNLSTSPPSTWKGLFWIARSVGKIFSLDRVLCWPVGYPCRAFPALTMRIRRNCGEQNEEWDMRGAPCYDHLCSGDSK